MTATTLVQRRTAAVAGLAFTPAALVLAAALWTSSVAGASVDGMSDYGLVSVLNWQFVASISLLSAAAARELSRPDLDEKWLAVVAVAFVTALFGFQPGIEKLGRLPTGWLHVGFADYIGAHGQVLHGYDARFSWPGFFAGVAMLTTFAGRHDALFLLRWAPLVYNLAALLPLLWLARTAASSRRVAWLGVLLYYVGNWIEQDYLSPQATAFLFYLVLLAALMWLARPDRSLKVGGAALLGRLWATTRRVPPRLPGIGPRGYVGLEIALVAILAGTVVSHQLTPFAMLLAVFVFMVSGRTRFRGLLFLLAVMVVAWFSFGAVEFWEGHLSAVFGDIGQLGTSVGSGVQGRVVGNAAHLRIQYLRLAVSAGFLLAAAVGFLSERRSTGGRLLAGLAAAPFALIAVQSYGGEVVLRVLLYALPALAILAAEAIHRACPGGTVRRVVVGVTLALGGLALIAARGGNEPFERVTGPEYQAMQRLYTAAPDDTSIAAVVSNATPLRYRDIDRHTFLDLDNCPTAAGDPTTCAVQEKPDFILLTSAQVAYGRLVEGRPADWGSSFVGALVSAGRYTVLYRNGDATVLHRVGARATGSP